MVPMGTTLGVAPPLPRLLLVFLDGVINQPVNESIKSKGVVEGWAQDQEALGKSDAYLSLSFTVREMRGLNKMNSNPALTLFIFMSLYYV